MGEVSFDAKGKGKVSVDAKGKGKVSVDTKRKGTAGDKGQGTDGDKVQGKVIEIDDEDFDAILDEVEREEREEREAEMVRKGKGKETGGRSAEETDSEDNDFVVCGDDEGYELDDVLSDHSVDRDAEWCGIESYQITKINYCHTCSSSFKVKQLNSTWLAKRYVEDFRSDPKKDVDGFRNFVARETKLDVLRHQAYRAKVMAQKLIEGSTEEQYNLIWDYVRALKDRNPGSTVKICVDQGADGRNKFSKLYVCFKALKTGFLAGCRPFICVDGTFLKGPHGRVLLTAVSVDPNNQIYPIAYAVVTTESTETWS
ncbi:hypothetical protein ACS0TY_001097 [Phlomoides rotata]